MVRATTSRDLIQFVLTIIIVVTRLKVVWPSHTHKHGSFVFARVTCKNRVNAKHHFQIFQMCVVCLRKPSTHVMLFWTCTHYIHAFDDTFLRVAHYLPSKVQTSQPIGRWTSQQNNMLMFECSPLLTLSFMLSPWVWIQELPNASKGSAFNVGFKFDYYLLGRH